MGNNRTDADRAFQQSIADSGRSDETLFVDAFEADCITLHIQDWGQLDGFLHPRPTPMRASIRVTFALSVLATLCAIGLSDVLRVLFRWIA